MKLPRLLYVVIALTAIAVLVNSVLVWVALSQVSDQGNRIEREGRERRDQSCLVLERRYAADVANLQRSYAYFQGLSMRQARENLNKALLQSLPAAERSARDDVPPRYCAEKGIGLDQKLQKLPARPPYVTELLDSLR